MPDSLSQSLSQEDTLILVDNLPEEVVATMEARDRFFSAVTTDEGAPRFVVSDLLKWTPGQTVRVAFLGGDAQLHSDIAEATRPITESCNIKLDFGFDPNTGKFRAWSTSDTVYQAEIRVSFDQPGFFSLVGRDSITPAIGTLISAVGGRPNQRSLNLGGFHIQRPANWKGVVRHEFLHALAFQHEHQSPNSACAGDFRWEDDPGYVPTANANGTFITDAKGRRPGIYTYLSGPPNQWSRAKVDHNLRPIQPGTVVAGPFDPQSVMLYRFPPLFYKSSPSPCAPTGNGEDLSNGDIDGLLLLYPTDPNLAGFAASGQRDALQLMLDANILPAELQESLRLQVAAIP